MACQPTIHLITGHFCKDIFLCHNVNPANPTEDYFHYQQSCTNSRNTSSHIAHPAVLFNNSEITQTRMPIPFSFSMDILSFSQNSEQCAVYSAQYTAHCSDCCPGQEVMGPAYRTAAGMMLCMFFAVSVIFNITRRYGPIAGLLLAPADSFGLRWRWDFLEKQRLWFAISTESGNTWGRQITPL